jgi:hypothetical protein
VNESDDLKLDWIEPIFTNRHLKKGELNDETGLSEAAIIQPPGNSIALLEAHAITHNRKGLGR